MKKVILITLIFFFFFSPLSFVLEGPFTSSGESLIAYAANDTKAIETECKGVVGCSVYYAGLYIVKALVFVPIAITGLLVQFSGMLLNLVLVKTVIQMGAIINQVGGIDIAWGVLRDLANILFIFGLLAIAISTILGLSSYGYKKLLATLIVVALIINFSLFFTKFIIDTSNLFATQFYTAIVGKGAVNNESIGISNAFVRGLGLTSAWNTAPLLGTLSKVGASSGGSLGAVFAYGIFVSIFFTITAFVFFTAAILLIIRMAVFVLLLVLSPLAFAALVLPQTAGLAKQWWEKLWQHALFAPFLLILFWVVIVVTPGIQASLGADGSLLEFLGPDSGLRASSIGVILNFFILIVLMLSAIVIANKLSMTGAKQAIGMSKWIPKLATRATAGVYGSLARNTIGRAGSKLAESKFMGRMQMLSPKLGGAAKRGLEKVGKTDFDIRTPLSKIDKDLATYTGKPNKVGGFDGSVRKIAERRQKTGDDILKALGKGKSVEEQNEIREEYARKLEQGGVADIKDIGKALGGAASAVKEATVAIGPKIQAAYATVTTQPIKTTARNIARATLQKSLKTAQATPGFVMGQVISPNIYEANKKAAENARKRIKNPQAQLEEDLKAINLEEQEALKGLEKQIRDASNEMTELREKLEKVKDIPADSINQKTEMEGRMKTIEDNQIKLRKEAQGKRQVFVNERRVKQDALKRAKELNEEFKDKNKKEEKKEEKEEDGEK